jgi:hypothetical protein
MFNNRLLNIFFSCHYIEAERIAQSLGQLFSRVGVARVILSDQGSNFTSTLLKQLYEMRRKMALSSVSVIPGFHFRLFVSKIFTYNVSHFRQALPNINDMFNNGLLTIFFSWWLLHGKVRFAVRKLSDVNYQVNVGARRGFVTYHINLLKRYNRNIVIHLLAFVLKVSLLRHDENKVFYKASAKSVFLMLFWFHVL